MKYLIPERSYLNGILRFALSFGTLTVLSLFFFTLIALILAGFLR